MNKLNNKISLVNQKKDQMLKMNFIPNVPYQNTNINNTNMNNPLLNTNILLGKSDQTIPILSACIEKSISSLDKGLEYIYSDKNFYPDICLKNLISQNTLSSPIQNGKRCGFIFVSRETVSSYCPNDVAPNVSFLVVKGRMSNIWSFPKGRMTDETESEEKCALRELFEETGIKFFTIKGLPRIVIGRNVYFIKHCNREDFKSFVIHDKYEVGEVSWKSVEELKKMSANKDIRSVLRYPNRVFPYHRLIYYPSKSRTMYSFKDVTKSLAVNINQPIEVM